MNIALITLYYDNYNELASLVLPNWQSYCDRHGYQLFAHRGSFGSGQIGFQKTAYVKNCLSSNQIDAALVLDLDILITNPSIKVEDFVGDDRSFFIHEDVNGFNSGSYIVKNDQGGMAVINHMLSGCGRCDCEQNMLKNHINDSVIKDNVKILPHPGFNSYQYQQYPEFAHHVDINAGQWNKTHLLLHLPGMSLDKRLHIFSNILSNQE